MMKATRTYSITLLLLLASDVHHASAAEATKKSAFCNSNDDCEASVSIGYVCREATPAELKEALADEAKESGS